MGDDGVNVRNRLKMFELDSTTPGKALPPVLQRLMKAENENGIESKPATSEKKRGHAPSPTAKPPIATRSAGLAKSVPKWGGGGKVEGGISNVGSNESQSNQDHNQNVVTGSTVNNSGSVSNATSMFERKLSIDSNKSNVDVASSKTPSATQNGLVHKVSFQASNKVPPGHSNVIRPVTPPKNFVAKPSSSNTPSPLSASDNDSSAKMSTKSGQDLADVLLKKKEENSSASSQSPPSTAMEKDSVSHDFQSNLHSNTKPSSVSPPPPPPKKAVTPSVSSTSSSSSSSLPPPSPVTDSSQNDQKNSSIVSQWKLRERKLSEEQAARPQLHKQISSTKPPEGNISVALRQRKASEKRTKSSNSIILERKHDGKKFRKINFDGITKDSVTPSKPTVPLDIDLTEITCCYHKVIIKLNEQMKADEQMTVADDEDDLYADCLDIAAILPRTSLNRNSSVRISVIPDMSAEEEGVSEDIYDTGFSPAVEEETADDIYDEGMTQKDPDEPLEGDDIYEDEESLAQQWQQQEKQEPEQVPEETEQERKKRLKKEDKERRDREKKEDARKKKEEKERLQREKEERKQRERFKLSGDEIDLGEGVITKDAKGRGDNLTVQRGEMVTILRIDKNPQNKWLVRSGTTLGYVDSDIIDIDPNIIRQAMTKQSKVSTAPSVPGEQDDDQPNYDDVPNDKDDEIDDGDIYEDCT